MTKTASHLFRDLRRIGTALLALLVTPPLLVASSVGTANADVIPNLRFGPQLVGTTSEPQSVWVTTYTPGCPGASAPTGFEASCGVFTDNYQDTTICNPTDWCPE